MQFSLVSPKSLSPLSSLSSLSSLPVDVIRIIDESSTVQSDSFSVLEITTTKYDSIDCGGGFVVQGRGFSINVFSCGSFLTYFRTTVNIRKLFLNNKHIIVFGKNHNTNDYLFVYTLQGITLAGFPIQLFDGYQVILNGALGLGLNTVVFHVQDWKSNTHVYRYSLDGRVLNYYCLAEKLNTDELRDVVLPSFSRGPENKFRDVFLLLIDSNLNLIVVVERQFIASRHLHLPVHQERVSLFHVSTFDSTGELISTRRYGPVFSVNFRHNEISRGNARVNREFQEYDHRQSQTSGLALYHKNLVESSNIFIVRDHLCAYRETETGFELFQLNEWKSSQESWCDFWSGTTLLLDAIAMANERSMVRQHGTFKFSKRFNDEIFIDSGGFICFEVAIPETMPPFQQTSFISFKIWL